MKKLFASTVAALAMTAGVSANEEPAPHDGYTYLDAGEVVLYEDQQAMVFADENAARRANGFIVMCPGYGMRDLYTPNPDIAVVRLYFNNRTSMESTLRSYQAWAPSAADNAHNPDLTDGLIGKDNRLVLTYTFNEHKQALRDFLATPGPLQSSPTQNPALVHTLRKHAVDFCFSRF